MMTVMTPGKPLKETWQSGLVDPRRNMDDGERDWASAPAHAVVRARVVENKGGPNRRRHLVTYGFEGTPRVLVLCFPEPAPQAVGDVVELRVPEVVLQRIGVPESEWCR